MKARRVVLRLAFVILSISAGLPAAARAQARLEAVYNLNGILYSQGSYDGGVNWTTLTQLNSGWCEARGGVGSPPPPFVYWYVGAPAVVSDQPGHVWMVGRISNGSLFYSAFSAATNSWSSCVGLAAGSGVEIGSNQYVWNSDSFPAVTSHQPGHLEIFIVAKRVRDGAQSLLHGYWVEDDQGFHWEFLGSGFLVGTPAVTSWGPGRMDVFVRTANRTLAHKWFENGQWSQGWEDMGGDVTSSPSVGSSIAGHLDVFAVGSDRAVWHRTFFGNAWSEWESIGGIIGTRTNPVATSSGPFNMEVFVYAADRTTLFQRTQSWGTWYHRQTRDWGVHVPMGATYWTP